jgi:hypothetical protein
MKARTMLAALTLSVVGLAPTFAADANLGTWKLNEAKSKFAPGANKNKTVVYSAAGDSVKVVVDGVDKDGKALHNEWTGKFDGTEYAVAGDPTYDARSYKKVDAFTTDSYKKVDAFTTEMTFKKAGKVMATGKIVVAADGKTRTVTTTAADPSVSHLSATAVYDKQ